MTSPKTGVLRFAGSLLGAENVEVTPTFFELAMSGRWIECGPAPGCPLP